MAVSLCSAACHMGQRCAAVRCRALPCGVVGAECAGLQPHALLRTLSSMCTLLVASQAAFYESRNAFTWKEVGQGGYGPRFHLIALRSRCAAIGFVASCVATCAGTRPHLRRDSPTSAPGLAHICARTRPHLRRDSIARAAVRLQTQPFRSLSDCSARPAAPMRTADVPLRLRCSPAALRSAARR